MFESNDVDVDVNDCCHVVSGVIGVDAVAIDARKLILSWTACCCCLSIFEFDCNDKEWNIDIGSSLNNLLTFDTFCCCVNWISASSIDDEVDDEADDDVVRIANGNCWFVIDFVEEKSKCYMLSFVFFTFRSSSSKIDRRFILSETWQGTNDITISY